jgi:glutathione S-transferase
MTTLTLYVTPGACSFGAHVALKELGIPHHIEIVRLRTPDSIINQVNPLGRVPALKTDSGEVITENSAILPYLADLKPEAGLIAPAGSVERAKIQEWIGFLNSDVQGAFKPVNRPELYHPDTSEHEKIKAHTLPRLLDYLKIIDSRLEGKTWAVGERFTIADAYLGVFWTWLSRRGFDLTAYPNIDAFGKRFDARPSVQAALEAENPLAQAA